MVQATMPGAFEPLLIDSPPPMRFPLRDLSENYLPLGPPVKSLLGARRTSSIVTMPIPTRKPVGTPLQPNSRGSPAPKRRVDDYGVFSTNPYRNTDSVNAWQQYDLPPELATVKAGTPNEIRKIVRDSVTHCRALRASMIDAQNDSAPHEIWQNPGVPAVMTHVRTASRNSNSTIGSLDRDSQSSDVYYSLESITSAESVASPATGKQYMTRASEHIHETVVSSGDSAIGAEKTSKKHGLMRLLRGRGNKATTDKSNDLSTSPASPRSPAKSTIELTKECASCFDDVPISVAISLRCQHSYCAGCFSQLVKTAMQHENFWPPKCCLHDIPKKTLEKYLSQLEYANYRLKVKEYSIPAGERWYCSSPDCGKWFCQSKYRSRDATVSCTHCSYRMCLFCRNPTHASGQRCPQDKGLDATLAAAELEGWQRCYNCHTMVELGAGCRHITCKCRAEFWYVDFLAVEKTF